MDPDSSADSKSGSHTADQYWVPIPGCSPLFSLAPLTSLAGGSAPSSPAALAQHPTELNFLEQSICLSNPKNSE